MLFERPVLLGVKEKYFLATPKSHALLNSSTSRPIATPHFTAHGKRIINTITLQETCP